MSGLLSRRTTVVASAQTMAWTTGLGLAGGSVLVRDDLLALEKDDLLALEKDELLGLEKDVSWALGMDSLSELARDSGCRPR